MPIMTHQSHNVYGFIKEIIMILPCEKEELKSVIEKLDALVLNIKSEKRPLRKFDIDTMEQHLSELRELTGTH